MESDTDVHLCLTCNEKINGLMNYVTHKQTKCSPKTAVNSSVHQIDEFSTSTTRNRPSCPSELNSLPPSSFVPDVNINIHTLTSEEKSTTRELSDEPITDIVLQSLPTATPSTNDNMSYNLLPNIQEFSGDISPSNNQTNSNTMNSLTLDIHQLDSFMNDEFPPTSTSMTSPSTDSFFQSLELQSRKSPNKGKPGVNHDARNIYSNLESLSITNFLNNLDFSSDDDITNFPSADELDDLEEDDKPPNSHTGGKWKPGQQPTGFQYKYSGKKIPGGKWKPGTLLKSSNSTGKTYICAVCNVSFSNCHSYSAHCREKNHKTLAQARNKEIRRKQDIIDSDSINRAREMSLGTPMELTKSSSASINTNTLECSENTGEKIILKIKTTVDKVGENTYQVEEVNTSSMSDPFTVSVTDSDKLPLVQDNNDSSDQVVHNENTREVDESRKRKRKEDNVSEKHICTICDKKFKGKHDIVRHLMTAFHRNRSMGHAKNLTLLTKYENCIAKLCAHQCQICNFYFNRHSDLIAHVATEEHFKKCHNPIGILTCLLCDVKCVDGEELKEHVSHSSHIKAIEKAKNQKICVLKDVVELKCKFCGLKQNSIKRLRRHILYRHQDAKVVPPVKRGSRKSRYPCEECKQTFAYPSALKLHIARLHVADKPFKCTVCERNFSSKYCLDKHLTTPLHARKMANDDQAAIVSVEEAQEVERVISVEESDKKTLKDEEVEVPVKQNKSKFKCQGCKFEASGSSDLSKHVIDHHKDELIECKLCDSHFLKRKAYLVHCSSQQHQNNLDNEEGEKSGVIECPKCSKKFADEKWRNLHVEFYHNHVSTEGQLVSIYGKNTKVNELYGEHLKQIQNMANDASVSCPECGKFVHCERIIEHLRLHTGEKPFACNICDRKFIARLSLRRHLMVHVGLTELTCSICNKEFRRLNSYRFHMDQHKSKEVHRCEECGVEFPLLKQLKLHLLRHGERKFKCTYKGCTWSFVFKNELKMHMVTHTGEKKYLCDTCGFAAATKSRLVRHKRKHTGERRYNCEYCTYKAGNGTHLKRHMRIHIGAKPFQCPYCAHACNTHENIRKHILKTKKHEGLPVYPCKFCNFGCSDTQSFRSHLITEHENIVTPQGLDKLAEYSGLYLRQNDPVKPEEGTQIIVPKERKRRGDNPRKPKINISQLQYVQIKPRIKESEIRAVEYDTKEHVTSTVINTTSDSNLNCVSDNHLVEIQWDSNDVPNIAYNTEINGDEKPTSSEAYSEPLPQPLQFIHSNLPEAQNYHSSPNINQFYQIIMNEHQYQQQDLV